MTTRSKLEFLPNKMQLLVHCVAVSGLAWGVPVCAGVRASSWTWNAHRPRWCELFSLVHQLLVDNRGACGTRGITLRRLDPPSFAGPSKQGLGDSKVVVKSWRLLKIRFRSVRKQACTPPPHTHTSSCSMFTG